MKEIEEKKPNLLYVSAERSGMLDEIMRTASLSFALY